MTIDKLSNALHSLNFIKLLLILWAILSSQVSTWIHTELVFKYVCWIMTANASCLWVQWAFFFLTLLFSLEIKEYSVFPLLELAWIYTNSLVFSCLMISQITVQFLIVIIYYLCVVLEIFYLRLLNFENLFLIHWFPL
jgi:hypothetical protein